MLNTLLCLPIFSGIESSNEYTISPNIFNISNETFSSYIRLDVSDKTGVLSAITNILSKNNVSVKRLIQNPFKSKKFASIIIISHKAKNYNLVKSIDELSNKKFVINKPKFFRIEEI